jgi:hypothetical protein
MSIRNKLILCFIFLILFNIFDTVSTKILLESGLTETNPFVNWIIINCGYIGVITFKLFAIITWFIFSLISLKRNGSYPFSFIYVAIGIYLFVNIYQVILLTMVL